MGNGGSTPLGETALQKTPHLILQPISPVKHSPVLETKPRALLTAELQEEPVTPQHTFSRCLHQEFILTTLVGQIPHMINTAQKQI